VYAGIRKDRRDDLALIVSEVPASAAAVFTANRVQASPVKVARKHLQASRGKVRAVLINAGNANCATRTGDRVADTCCRALGRYLNVPVGTVFPASTGVIGVELDAQLIVGAIPALVAGLSDRRFPEAARAIMTTDLVPKVAFAELALKAGTIQIAGMTKGSGMIHPRMATTLGFVLTDAAVSPAMLRSVLANAVNRSYNCLSVDGDTSTNDTVLLLANGVSGVTVSARNRGRFEEKVSVVMEDLASQIAKDGEGATKLVTIDVSGAADTENARRIARAIANSPLVKTAIAGSDPNWGRILSAAGNAGVNFDPAKVSIEVQGIVVCRGGLAADFAEDDLRQRLNTPDCAIRFSIRGKGRGHARFFTCDFTEGYIRINASYRT
jgi:glutamate N-acetyltransferase/amino-acid N-acetyltransferase